MTFSSLPPDVREVAERVLTEKQLEAFEYECAGWSLMRIGRHLRIRKQSVAGRLEAAHDRLLAAGVKQDAYGQWSLEEAA